MALKTELLKRLNDDDESMQKRLKIANNAFKSAELPIRQREFFLLKWITSATDNDNLNIWLQLQSWLSSPQIMELSRTDILQEDLICITKTLSERLQGTNNIQPNIREIMYNVAISIINNPIFQQHFKYDIQHYCQFVADTMANIHEEEMVIKYINNEQLLNKSIITDNNFKNIFLEINLKAIIEVAYKFSTSKVIFEGCSKLIQRCLFQRNLQYLTTYLKSMFSEEEEKNVKFSNMIFHIINNSCIEKSKLSYQLILHSFYKSYSTNFTNVYQFIILLLNNMGYSLEVYKSKPLSTNHSKFDNSLQILVGIFDVISTNKNDFNSSINDITFNDFIKNILKSVISLTVNPNEETFQLLQLTIKINPLIIESTINEIINYLLLSDISAYQNQYNNLIISIFDVFSKLHRIPNFIHKLLAVLNTGVETKDNETLFTFDTIDKKQPKQVLNYNIKSTFSSTILDHFAKCVTSLASWQMINLFKALLFQLESLVGNLETILEDEKKIFFMECLSVLLCEVLSSVRIAEHTITTLVLDKFVKIMENLKDILQGFGTSLVQMEHNHFVMRAFLNICVKWADVYITLEYYSINNEVFLKKNTNSNDFSTCNITYLHSYLTSEQWCLISERITNFGEEPCKQILHKLYIQKLKAMYLFETEVNPECINSIINSTASTLDLNWGAVLNDKFTMNTIVPKLEQTDLNTLANFLLNDLVESTEQVTFQNWKTVNNPRLNKTLLLTLLQRINKLFRQKRKHEEGKVKKNCSSKIVQHFTEDFEGIDETACIEIFTETINSEDSNVCTVDVSKMKLYLDVFKNLPILYFDQSVQNAGFLYLCAILHDLNSFKADDSEINKSLESLILSIIQVGSITIIENIPANTLIHFVSRDFMRYEEFFEYIADFICKSETRLEDFQTGIKLLKKHVKSDEKYLQLCVILIKRLNKSKKVKITPEHKLMLEENKNKILGKLIKLIIEEKLDSVDIYSLALSNYVTNNTEIIASLLPLLDSFLKQAHDNLSKGIHLNGSLFLLLTVIQNKSVTKPTDEDKLIVESWNICKNLSITEKNHEVYSKLIILIFEHIPNDKFKPVLDDIILSLSTALVNQNDAQIENELNRWAWILPSSFNPTKLKEWQTAIENLLRKFVDFYEKKSLHKSAIQFIISLIASPQLPLTSTTLDLILLLIPQILSNSSLPESFHTSFESSITILETLVKHRRHVILDRLPAFLQHYRRLLCAICQHSPAATAALTDQSSDVDVQRNANCAHNLEKLTNALVSCGGKHMTRISPNLISDFLRQFETSAIHTDVRLHLNNCVYALLTVCDHHAIAYLMRVLSAPSTEIFKVLCDTYKKYYKFTGKV